MKKIISSMAIIIRADQATLLSFFEKVPSFEAREANRYLNNRLGIFRARGRGLLDHAVCPISPSISYPYGEASGGQLIHNCVLYILFPSCYIVCHMS